MAPRLQILNNVIKRLQNVNESVTGYLYGVMYDNTLTVLTFSLNVHCETEPSINHTILQLSMPAEVYLCGVLHVGEREEKLSDTFQDIDITDNPLLLKYFQNEPDVKLYFYIHQKLEAVEDVHIINEDVIAREFVYVRLQGSLPLVAQNDNVVEILEEARKNVASGKVGIHFPSNNTYLFDSDNDSKDTPLKELVEISENNEGLGNMKRKSTPIAGFVNAVQANILLKMSGDGLSEEHVKYAPVLQHVRRPLNSLEGDVNIDALSLVNIGISSSELHPILVESICRNIKLIEKCIEGQLQKTTHSMKLPIPIHFKPPTCGHLLTLVYQSSDMDSETAMYRKMLHQALALDLTRPYFRYGNAVKFRNDVQKNNLLINPHESIPQNEDMTRNTRKVGIVQGFYAYHHYMQDNFDDNGWGCAYRSLQTIISWYRLQGYTNIPVPSHTKIQKCLVDIGDKSTSFVGSKQWIGSTEARKYQHWHQISYITLRHRELQ